LTKEEVVPASRSKLDELKKTIDDDKSGSSMVGRGNRRGRSNTGQCFAKLTGGALQQKRIETKADLQPKQGRL
jgi:hypothetical protein